MLRNYVVTYHKLGVQLQEKITLVVKGKTFQEMCEDLLSLGNLVVDFMYSEESL